jgi:hypothetical protein
MGESEIYLDYFDFPELPAHQPYAPLLMEWPRKYSRSASTTGPGVEALLREGFALR